MIDESDPSVSLESLKLRTECGGLSFRSIFVSRSGEEKARNVDESQFRCGKHEFDSYLGEQLADARNTKDATTRDVKASWYNVSDLLTSHETP